MSPSFQSRIVTWILAVFKVRYFFEKKAGQSHQKRKKGFIPKRIQRKYSIKPQSFQDVRYATFETKHKVTRNHFLFFHGGAYIFETTRGHWRLAEKIVRKCFCRMTLVDYPLAPEHNYRETFSAISGVYDQLARDYPDDLFILMGDSAGGGLALAFTQKLIQDHHQKLPVKLVLLSPWLDLTLSNPEIRKQEDKDYLLTVNMLRSAAGKYSAGGHEHHFLLSPINGAFENLPETLLFYGTEELFYPDCKRFQMMIQSNNHNHVVREYPLMQHDWAIFPIPESKQVVLDICEFIEGI